MDAQRIANEAQTDQTAEAWRNHARVMHAYYAELVLSGFSKRQAMELVVQAQELSLTKILWPEGGRY